MAQAGSALEAGLLPERVYTKAELQTYLEHGRNKCQARLETLTDAMLTQIRPDWPDNTVAGLLLYNMRHVQEHAAQLSLFLGQKLGLAPGWVAQLHAKINTNNPSINIMSKDIKLRTGFNSEARLYHEIRPHYPEPLFDDLVKVTNLQTTASLLEIGPGTGQATESLAKRGYKITAIELGSDLAEVAREALKKYQNVEVVTGAFEEVQFPPKSFDLVYAATAFHWINPEVRFKKPYNLLKENGYLAIIHTNHVSDEVGDEFFFASQPIYKYYKLDNQDDHLRPPKTVEIKPDQLDTTLFTLSFFKAYPLVVNYSADEYTKLISTYSPTIAMPLQIRVEFLRELSNLIDKEFGGITKKHFAMTLTVAKKKG